VTNPNLAARMMSEDPAAEERAPRCPSPASPDRELSALFRPSSVAVVGASATPGKWGYLMVRHIIDNGYAGRLFPVNPRAGEILGITAYASVRDVPEPIDLAIIGVSAAAVPRVLEECAATGCRVAVVVTSGFGDQSLAGRRLERTLAAQCRAAGLRIVGPNCLGVYSAQARLYASLALDVSNPGRVALVSQSGNVGVALFQDGAKTRLGIHSFVGLGNQADLGFHDLIDFLATDDTCSVIALYVESLTDAPRFFDAVTRCTPVKPVVALKGGRGRQGARAAQSHTGALATDGRVFDDLIRQAGGIPVATLQELSTTALVLDRSPHHRADELAVLTDGGGFAVLVADEWEALGKRLATVTTRTKDALRGLLPPYCSAGNPTDVGGDSDSDPEVIGRAAEALIEDPGVSSLLVTGIVGGYGDAFNPNFLDRERRAVDGILRGWRQTQKPLLVHSLWELSESPILAELADAGVPVVHSLDMGLRALAHLDTYVRGAADSRQRRGSPPARRHVGLPVDRPDEATLYAYLAELGFSVPRFAVVRDETELTAASEAVGYPLVAKALLPGVAHKSELGAVRTRIGSTAELRRHMRDLRKLSDDVLLVEMLHSPVELLLGGVRSEQFGVLVSVGLGGLLAEAVGETVFMRAPLSRSEASAALARSPTMSRVLASRRRGRRPLAKQKVVQAILLVSQVLVGDPRVTSLEINPLIVDEEHAWVADAKLQWA
jgi:acetate---CoA ligase (ADP-forming)